MSDRIVLDIKEQIVAGGLKRGTRLPSEKELSEMYGVSGPTVREATRALSMAGFIEVQHGRGAFVTADAVSLVAMSLGAAVRLENVTPADALNILSVLNVHAARCAAENATKQDLGRLREAAEALAKVDSPQQAAAAGAAFHKALVQSAHNPLLEALTTFLSTMQAEFALQVAGGSMKVWRDMLGSLQEMRMKLVDAIERRDTDKAEEYARAFGREAVGKLVSRAPKVSAQP
jgi:GntR family transcriptional repressor for pyruvate dehydrogenase complex